MLAGEASDESAAANLTLRFQAAQHGQKFAPWRSALFAREQIAEHHTPSQQQLPGPFFDRIRGCFGAVRRMRAQRPAAWRGRMTSAAFATATFGIDQSAQILEAIGGDEARGDELPESIFYFARETVRSRGSGR